MLIKDKYRLNNINLRVNYEIIEEVISNDNNFKIVNSFGEIKKDILVERKKYYRIYGKAISSDNKIYKGIMVKLIKYKEKRGCLLRKEIDKAITDLYGEFNFIVVTDENIQNYIVELDD